MTPPAFLAALDATLANAWPPTLAPAQVQHLLIEALYRNRLVQAAEALLALDPDAVAADGRAQAQAALDACRSIAAETDAERHRMMSRLTEGGVEVVSDVSSESPPLRPYHAFTLQITPATLDRALAVARAEGYRPWEAWQGGAWRSFQRTHAQMTLVKTDAVTTRLVLRWRSSSVESPWRHRLQPSTADYHFVDLPAALWPLYYAVKPMRLIAERVFGRRRATSTAPFLGTPMALLPDLLDVAGVTADDVVVDLGCGDGRVVIEAARARGCRARGVEHDAALAERARANVRAAALDTLVQIDEGDATTTPLGDATVVFLFLPVETLTALIPSLRGRLPSGARIVVHEQMPLGAALTPDASTLLIADAALTVAHRWTVS